MRYFVWQPQQYGILHLHILLAVTTLLTPFIAMAEAQVPIQVAAEEVLSSILSNETISLPHKPTAPLSYGFSEGRGGLGNTHLLVFLNGLASTRDIWYEAIDKLVQNWDHGVDGDTEERPALLAYNRYGQGNEARDPYDETHEFGHDLREVVRDLQVLVTEIWKLKKPSPSPTSWLSNSTGDGDGPGSGPKLIFVANSIGCVIGRYFEQTYPGTTSALLFLDSNIANSDQISLFPDPDAPNFDLHDLPVDVTVDDLRRVREGYRDMFGPDVRNHENFDRRNVAELLPYADRPALRGTGMKDGSDDENWCGPWITVVGHDPQKFAEDSAESSLECPVSLTNKYVNPAWEEYNKGLMELTTIYKQKYHIANGCGHFIQKDDPEQVANLIQDLVREVEVEKNETT